MSDNVSNATKSDPACPANDEMYASCDASTSENSHHVTHQHPKPAAAISNNGPATAIKINNNPKKKLVRSNSTSSLYSISGTIDVPENEAILTSMGVIVYGMIQNTGSGGNSAGDIFFCPSNTSDVTAKDIVRFLKKSFQLAQWSPECHVYALVLLTRMHHHGSLVSWRNWNKQLLVALLIAQKMWDDVPLTNCDFPQLWTMVLPHSTPFTGIELSRMEVAFIKRIQWEAHVTRAVYTQFYFELQSLSLWVCQDERQLCGFAARQQTEKELIALEVRTQQSNPSSHVLHHLHIQQREESLRQPKTGKMPLRHLANRTIKVLS
jgi:hypothetical protein